MKRIIYLTVLVVCTTTAIAQTSFAPSLLFGERSQVYAHRFEVDLSSTYSITNITLMDAEYESTENLLYFTRTSFNYDLKSWRFLVGTGIKNTGIFTTGGAQYTYRYESFQTSYFLGLTFVGDRATLEQNFSLRFNPMLSQKLRFLFDTFVIHNSDHKGMDRVIQQMRLGLTMNDISFGAAFKMDQFRNREVPLTNIGVFVMAVI
ncbi:hypothetical protein [Phaeocystidibacter marisrubri]|uniref:DUF481 domain-containing protein n=1 Tax=Phaeocystidibacter marisrubri TaxID=1577780 RepID=A0A6L3ZDR8_9FLAO|nr:hypothetical protein [Phaeocystidibacter marisrubri]KAB2815542.1 hypothetical protein F8C82_07510 [Phaeocystidibacter marisrubri]GGH64434.1 hypothetical protein GCM10011318_00460 [Phaeocystidibacter marisrubri]